MKRPSFGWLAVVVTVALVGVLIGRVSMSSADRPAQASDARRAAAPSERSAAAAAIAYLEALRWNVLVDARERRAVIDSRATREAAPGLDAELAGPAAALREAVNVPPVVARTAILGYRVQHLDDGRAAVRIWGLALFATGTYAAATQWTTSDLTLVWSGDRWLVDRIESRGGPSPSSGVKVLARRSHGLEQVRHVP